MCAAACACALAARWQPVMSSEVMTAALFCSAAASVSSLVSVSCDGPDPDDYVSELYSYMVQLNAEGDFLSFRSSAAPIADQM